jgi:hypothetical protein
MFVYSKKGSMTFARKTFAWKAFTRGHLSGRHLLGRLLLGRRAKIFRENVLRANVFRAKVIRVIVLRANVLRAIVIQANVFRATVIKANVSPGKCNELMKCKSRFPGDCSLSPLEISDVSVLIVISSLKISIFCTILCEAPSIYILGSKDQLSELSSGQKKVRIST